MKKEKRKKKKNEIHSLNFLIKNESSFFNNNFEFIFCSSVNDLSLIFEINFLFSFLSFNSLLVEVKSITEFRLDFPKELLFVLQVENFLFNLFAK